MKKQHDSQFSLKERNTASDRPEKMDSSEKNYSTNPRSESSVPERTGDKEIDDKGYPSQPGGNKLKDDDSATDRTKYKTMDYGSTGKRNHPNKA